MGRRRCARYVEQDLAASPPGGLLTETCLSALPLPGHDLLDRGRLSGETRAGAAETRRPYLQEVRTASEDE